MLSKVATCQVLWVAPVLDMKGDAGSLDGLKVFGVAGREWQAKPDGNGGNQSELSATLHEIHSL